jgi:hypothetical protein
MDPILQTLFSWQFVLFGMSVAAVMFVIRKIVEYLISTRTDLAKNSKLWNDLILPILPVVLGAVGALTIKQYPYPYGLTTNASRFIFGLVAGLLSTLLYRVFKALLFQKNDGENQYVPSTSQQVTTNTINIAQPGNSTPDNPVDPEALALQVRQTINKQ